VRKSYEPNGNGLTFANKVRVVNRLQAEKDRVLAEKPSYTDLARRYTQELGFKVNRGLIITVMEATGIIWKPERSRPFASVKTPRYANLVEEVLALRKWCEDAARRCRWDPPANTGFGAAATEANGAPNGEFVASAV
jgi:hypothetical protein